MNQPETTSQSAVPAPIPPTGGGTCGSCGSTSPQPAVTASPFVYVIGNIQPHYPSLSVEKEVAQAIGRVPSGKQTDRQVLQSALADPKNAYLVRELCWVLSVQGIERYILVPAVPTDYELLVEAYSANPDSLFVVIGVQGPIAGPQVCNGLQVPILVFDLVYALSKDSITKSLPKPPAGVDANLYTAAAGEVFDRVTQLAGNDGRGHFAAINYLIARSPSIYNAVAIANASNSSLVSIEAKRSPLASPSRDIADVVITFMDRTSGVCTRQAATVQLGKYPFLLQPLAPYYGN